MDTKSNTWKCVASSNERLSDSTQECHCRMKILALRCDMHYSISKEHVTRSPYHLRIKIPAACRIFKRDTFNPSSLRDSYYNSYYNYCSFSSIQTILRNLYIFLSTIYMIHKYKYECIWKLFDTIISNNATYMQINLFLYFKFTSSPN